MNTYHKFAPNVFIAKCTEKYKKNDIIDLTTRRGDIIENVVHNLIFEKDGFYYYSITRFDGFNLQERAKNKSERYKSWAISAIKKSDDEFRKTQKHSGFLSLGEPIKVGHHSEKKHRKLFERNDNYMRKSISYFDKAEEHAQKSESWANRIDEINLSIPESVEYYLEKLEKAKEYHEGLKSKKYPIEHRYTMAYAKKEVNKFTKLYNQSNLLWS